MHSLTYSVTIFYVRMRCHIRDTRKREIKLNGQMKWWGRKTTENFHDNIMFWKELQRIRKRASGYEGRVKAENGTILVE